MERDYEKNLIRNTISMVIYNKRTELNMSVKQLANKLGVTDRIIYYWESIDPYETREPNVSELYRLSQILNFELQELINQIEDERGKQKYE